MNSLITIVPREETPYVEDPLDKAFMDLLSERYGAIELMRFFDDIPKNLREAFSRGMNSEEVEEVIQFIQTPIVLSDSKLRISYPVSRNDLFPNVIVEYQTNGQVTILQIMESIGKFYDQSLSPENVRAYMEADPQIDFTEEDVVAGPSLYDALIGTDYTTTGLVAVNLMKNGVYQIELE